MGNLSRAKINTTASENLKNHRASSRRACISQELANAEADHHGCDSYELRRRYNSDGGRHRRRREYDDRW
jgi:hypothetical protein